MSYTMTHLIIANEFIKTRKIADKELFLLSSVSPDAVHSRKDFSFELKADAHDLQPEVKWGQIYTEEAMLKWYHRLREFYHEKQKLVKNEEEDIFLQGYTLHILTDIFNCKLLYAKNLIRYDFKVELMRDEYRRECILQDNYLYQNYAESSEIMRLVKEASEHRLSDDILQNLQLAQYISVQNIKDSVSFFADGFEKATPASIEHLEMVSEKGTEEFLKTVIQEADRLLFEFPDEVQFTVE